MKKERQPILKPQKKKGPSRKRYVPIWTDPNLNAGDLIISYYIPITFPEVPKPDEPTITVKGTLIMKAKLPRGMTNAQFHAFEHCKEGRDWMNEVFAKAKEKRKIMKVSP